MDLSALTSTLPPGLADAERDMGDKFRAAALSITNLYKSSLSYTKQAYHVGYSACLSDVLSTVQSSIGAGQDATLTLSRLMDWAEARETAMAAFAAEESDYSDLPHPPPTKASLAKQALSRLAQQHQTQLPTPTPSTPSLTHPSKTYQPTPIIASSPVSLPPNSLPRPPAPLFVTRKTAGTSTSHSPTRTTEHRFNPALPRDMPVPAVGAVATGSKRPHVGIQDYEMEESSGSGGVGGRRASKRRSLAGGREEERDGAEGRGRVEKSRGRKGHGHGHGRDGGAAGPGTGVI